MIKFELAKYAPKTDNPINEGGRLALLNTAMLLIIGLFIYGVLWLIDGLRRFGIPLLLPVWLLMLLTGIPYFVIWFEYGRAFGSKLQTPSFLSGLAMGCIGQIPGFIFYFIISRFQSANIEAELLRIIGIIFRTFIIVVPIMAALGSLDTEKGQLT